MSRLMLSSRSSSMKCGHAAVKLVTSFLISDGEKPVHVSGPLS